MTYTGGICPNASPLTIFELVKKFFIDEFPCFLVNVDVFVVPVNNIHVVEVVFIM